MQAHYHHLNNIIYHIIYQTLLHLTKKKKKNATHLAQHTRPRFFTASKAGSSMLPHRFLSHLLRSTVPPADRPPADRPFAASSAISKPRPQKFNSTVVLGG